MPKINAERDNIIHRRMNLKKTESNTDVKRPWGES